MFTLPTILKINAISSGITGLILLSCSQYMARMFKIYSDRLFILVGLFLIGFAIFVMFQAVQNPLNLRQISTIIWLDSAWVVASIITVAVFYRTVSGTGILIILLVAVWVALMAFLQNSKLIRL